MEIYLAVIPGVLFWAWGVYVIVQIARGKIRIPNDPPKETAWWVGFPW